MPHHSRTEPPAYGSVRSRTTAYPRSCDVPGHWRMWLACHCACLAGERDWSDVHSTRWNGPSPPHLQRQGLAETAIHRRVRRCRVADQRNLVLQARQAVRRLKVEECGWVGLSPPPGSKAYGQRSSEAPRGTRDDEVRDAGAPREAVVYCVRSQGSRVRHLVGLADRPHARSGLLDLQREVRRWASCAVEDRPHVVEVRLMPSRVSKTIEVDPSNSCSRPQHARSASRW